MLARRARGSLGVADGGLGVEAEDRGEMRGDGAVGEGFFELAVDAQAFEGGGLAWSFLANRSWRRGRC